MKTGQKKALEAYSRAIQRESHVLTKNPGMLWQQLYNRLQWEEEHIIQYLAPQFTLRSITGCKPWTRTRLPIRESRSLLRTLSGHISEVNGCVVSPDGNIIASACNDHTIRLWDLASATEHAVLIGHTGEVKYCQFNHSGTLIVSASADRTLKLWGVASGLVLCTFKGHQGIVTGCAFTPDGAWIVSASEDRTLKVWDAASGEEKLTLPLAGSSGGLALHPWQPSAVCGDRGGSLFILDLVGVSYGPIISTAIQGNRGLKVRYPACQHQLQITEDQHGTKMTCPTEACSLELKINPFVIQMT